MAILPRPQAKSWPQKQGSDTRKWGLATLAGTPARPGQNGAKKQTDGKGQRCFFRRWAMVGAHNTSERGFWARTRVWWNGGSAQKFCCLGEACSKIRHSRWWVSRWCLFVLGGFERGSGNLGFSYRRHPRPRLDRTPWAKKKCGGHRNGG